MNEKEFADLSAAYALGALSPGEERAYLDALAAHPDWQTIADADAAAVAPLAEAVAEVTPPADLRDVILARAAALPHAADDPATSPEPAPGAREAGTAPPDGAAERAAPRSRPRWGRWVFALAACLIVLGGAGFGAVSLGEWLNRSPAVVALDEIENAQDSRAATVELEDGGVATARWSPSLGEVVVVTDGLPEIAPDQSFELWFVRGDAPISAGTFEVGEDGTATALLDGELHQGDVIAVTVEQAGGSPTGQPTSDPIIAIDTT